MNGFTLFGKELKQIFTDKKVLIPIIAILFVPLIYAGMFLWSFKDPYAKMDELPVALVNNDKGATMDEKSLTVGSDLVDNLLDSNNFEFHLVTQEEAIKGLENRDYYMVIEIPEDFSENATTLLDDNPKKLQLKYIPNESQNFLAGQIGETAVDKVRAAVSAEVSKTYAETMFDTAMDMADGFKTASDGAGKLDDGAKKLHDGAKEIKDNLELLASKSIEFKEGMETAHSGSTELASGSQELSSGLGQLTDASGQLLDASKTVQKGSNDLASGISAANEGAQTLKKNIPQLVNGTKQVQDGLKAFQTQLPKQMSEQIGSQLTSSAKKMNAGLDELQQGVNGGITQLQQSIAAVLTNEQLSSDEKVNMLLTQLSDPKADLKGQINAGFDQYKSEVNSQLTSAASGLEGMIKAGVDPTFKQLNDGVSAIYQGQLALQAGVDQLTDGANKLQAGANTLSNGQQQYVEKMQLFAQKLSEAKTGANQLAGGAIELNKGLNTLSDGSSQLSDGASQLADGSGELYSGTTDLRDGTKELSEKLGDAAEETSSLHADDKTYDMMADPVTVNTHAYNPVPNYGTGFAPYFISLGLFVGALLLTIIFPLEDPAGLPKSGFSWFMSKFGVMALVGFVQAIFVALLVLYGLDIEVKNIPLFMLFTLITSLTFITLIQFLVTLFKNPGRFIAILILILQLTSSAGTFPLEVIPRVVQWFNPLLPMTYSVQGFKAVISSGDYSFMWQNAGILFAYIIGSMLITVTYFVIKFRNNHNPADHEQTVAA